jgi:hypothetical protein
MSLRGYSKDEFYTPSNRYVKVLPLPEEPEETFEDNNKIWNDLRIWNDQFVWDE